MRDILVYARYLSYRRRDTDLGVRREGSEPDRDARSKRASPRRPLTSRISVVVVVVSGSGGSAVVWQQWWQ